MSAENSAAGNRFTVLVTSRSFSSGERDLHAELASIGAVAVEGAADHDLELLRPLLADADAWIAGLGPVSAEHLDAAPRLRIVARHGVGYDAVDVAAAEQRRVLVTNTPGANSDAVADHAMALILALLRHVVAGDHNVRAGRWESLRTRELGSLTVGMIGFGRIGRGVAKRLDGFGSTVLAHDPGLPDRAIAEAGAEPVTMADLAQRSDVVSLHAPGGSTLITKEWLRSARPGMLLVNTARANLVEESAVAEAIRAGRLAGFAADTLSTEGADADSPLLADELADKVLLTPHWAAQTTEAVDRMGGGATESVIAVLTGAQPANVVSAPVESGDATS